MHFHEISFLYAWEQKRPAKITGYSPCGSTNVGLQQGEVGLTSFFAFRFSFFVFRYSNWVGKSYFDIQNPIFTIAMSRKILFWYSKSYFDILTESENRILTFKILFWHSHWVGKSYFDIQNPILTFELSRKIVFWHSKFFSDSVRMSKDFPTQCKCQNRILNVKLRFSDSVRMSK